MHENKRVRNIKERTPAFGTAAHQTVEQEENEDEMEIVAIITQLDTKLDIDTL